MALSATINILRLFIIFILILPIYFVNKDKAIVLFLSWAGPSFLKLGQILSTRQDLVGEALAKKLEIFQDNVKPFPRKKVDEILQQEFAHNFTKIFYHFNKTPIASASIAQVHQATLIDGTKVAVKILRPNIRQIMRRDIDTLILLTKLIYPFSRFFYKELTEITQLLEQTAKHELDLLLEGANASRLKEEMQNSKGFYVPKIFWPYSSSQILISEWIDGIKFSDQEAINNSGLDKKTIAENLVLNYFQQVYVNGFFHADMHPGNLFLLKNGDIAVVDFGIMGKIDKKERIAIAKILIGFLDRNYYDVAKIHIEGGFVPKDTNIDELSLSCRKIGEMIVGRNVLDISITKLLTALIEMSRNYKMNGKPELLLLQKTLLLVEGVGVMLDPNLNIWNLARPWVKEWAQTNIGFDAKIRDFLVDIYQKINNFLEK